MNNLIEIDLKPLEDELLNKFGIPIVFTKEGKIDRYGHNRLDITSQDLKDVAGIMSTTYQYLHITGHGNSAFDTETGIDSMICMSIQFSFKYLRGGSNGHIIGYCWYKIKEKSWEFQFD